MYVDYYVLFSTFKLTSSLRDNSFILFPKTMFNLAWIDQNTNLKVYSVSEVLSGFVALKCFIVIYFVIYNVKSLLHIDLNSWKYTVRQLVGQTTKHIIAMEANI